MRIAEVATLAAPVGPEAGGPGSVESLVHSLAGRLVSSGHEVTVFAAAGSSVPGGRLVATVPGPYGTNGAPDDWQLCEWINLCRAVEQSGDFDVLHSHAYLWGLPLERLARAPMVHTLHVWPYDDSATLRRAHPGATVTAPSAAQWRSFPDLAPTAVVPHGLEPDRFPLRTTAGTDACYLGRFIPEKGPVEAVRIARAAGLRLAMAGPPNEYFRCRVAPLVDGRDVEYLGPVTAAERAELLGSSGLLLAPMQAPEPFCLVLAEAMLCGTPAVAPAIGAAPEVVDAGRTGYCWEPARDPVGTGPGSPAELVHAALCLDRRAVHERALRRFGADRMAQDYLDVYAEAVAG